MTSIREGGENLKGFKDFRTENGSSQDHNLALTGLVFPSSLDSGNKEEEGFRRVRGGVDPPTRPPHPTLGVRV